jgi:hypothetical protein
VSIDIEAEDLLAEVNRALATSMMSMSNKGSSTQMQVGLSNQTEKQIIENIMAVYESMPKHFPGKFENIRSLYIRFGNNTWTVPIYVSFGNLINIVLCGICNIYWFWFSHSRFRYIASLQETRRAPDRRS